MKLAYALLLMFVFMANCCVAGNHIKGGDYQKAGFSISLSIILFTLWVRELGFVIIFQ